MKKDKREAYLTLAEEVDFLLCSFCKFADHVGCGEMDCNHPLGEQCGLGEDLMPGDDCWGFRPTYDVSLTADIVGIMLTNGWTTVSWYTNEEGRLVVAGYKDLWN